VLGRVGKVDASTHQSKRRTRQKMQRRAARYGRRLLKYSHQPSTTLLTPLASVYNPGPFRTEAVKAEPNATNEKESPHTSDWPGWRKNAKNARLEDERKKATASPSALPAVMLLIPINDALKLRKARGHFPAVWERQRARMVDLAGGVTRPS
jgi:hypothetical protein